MFEQIKCCNNIFCVDIVETKSYYASYSEICDCQKCRNYYQLIKSYSTSLNDFLDQFGIDIEKPIEIVCFEANNIDHTVEYIAYYSVNGSVDVGEGEIEIGDVKVSVEKPELSPNTEMTELYFILEISKLHLPWCITDDIDVVFPDIQERENISHKIKSLLLRIFG